MIHTIYDHGDEVPAVGLTAAQVAGALSDAAGALWLDMDSCTDVEVRAVLAACGVGESAAEACLRPARRPQLRDLGGSVFLSLRAPSVPLAGTAEPSWADVGAFLGPNYLVTVHGGAVPAVANVRDAITGTAFARSRGADGLVALLLHQVVEGVHEIVRDVADAMEAVEAGLVDGRPASDSAARCFTALRALRCVCRETTPLVEAVHRLGWSDLPVVPKARQPAFQEVHDRLVTTLELAHSRIDRAQFAMKANAAASADVLARKTRLLAALLVVFLPALFAVAWFGLARPIAPSPAASSSPAYVVGALLVLAATTGLVYRLFR